MFGNEALGDYRVLEDVLDDDDDGDQTYYVVKPGRP